MNSKRQYVDVPMICELTPVPMSTIFVTPNKRKT